MSYYFINGETLTNIADAIREKTGFSNPLAPGEMATAITNIENAGGGDPGTETEVLLISEEVTVDTAIQGTSLTLLSNNSFIADNCNNENLFVILSSIELSEIDSSAYSNCYQWTSIFASNKVMTFGVSDMWYGMGIYLMTGKGYSYPSTLEIPYSLSETSATNYSYLKVNSNGEISIYICGYDVLAAGRYRITAGLFN